MKVFLVLHINVECRFVFHHWATSSIRMNRVSMELFDNKICYNTLTGINETVALVFVAKRNSDKSDMLNIGGISPNNSILHMES